MKRIILVILIAAFGITSSVPMVVNATPIYEQRRDDKKKNPPGPPVVKPKESRGDKSSNRPSGRGERPRKNKKPGDE